MITKEMVRKGLQLGLIKIVDSNWLCEVVCKIGDYWFFFGGEAAEDTTVEEFLENVPEDDIVDSIFDVLESFRNCQEVFGDEYAYYESYLVQRFAESDGEKADKALNVREESYRIVDLFEDLLDRFDIDVPSPGDEEDRKANDNSAHLYGCVYGDLCDEVESRLKNIVTRFDADAKELKQYRALNATPEEIDKIFDAYGRGMTLREENGVRLEAVRKIKTDRLKELAAAEERGSLIDVPCNVGDTAYCLSGRYYGRVGVLSGEVTEIQITDDRDVFVVLKNVGRGRIGEKVFMTFEEADKVWKGEKNG